jgi:hypothetical protein
VAKGKTRMKNSGFSSAMPVNVRNQALRFGDTSGFEAIDRRFKNFKPTQPATPKQPAEKPLRFGDTSGDPRIDELFRRQDVFHKIPSLTPEQQAEKARLTPIVLKILQEHGYD